MMTHAVVVPCPLCESPIKVHHPLLGRHVECPECEELFVVSSCSPLELTYALDMEDEGWFAEDERRQA